jgi:flagellar assembly protein FliH
MQRFEYLDICETFPFAGLQPFTLATADQVPRSPAEAKEAQLTKEHVALQIANAKEQGRQLGLEQARQANLPALQAAVQAERGKVCATVENFVREAASYYSNVENEVVHLSLAIAAKILHREAQVDKLLLAGLARVAIQRLQEGTNVRVRVRPAMVDDWKRSFAEHPAGCTVEITADPTLADNDCVLETEAGTVQVGVDAQLKEIERGFFDLLAHRPECRHDH